MYTLSYIALSVSRCKRARYGKRHIGRHARAFRRETEYIIASLSLSDRPRRLPSFRSAAIRDAIGLWNLVQSLRCV